VTRGQFVDPLKVAGGDQLAVAESHGIAKTAPADSGSPTIQTLRSLDYFLLCVISQVAIRAVVEALLQVQGTAPKCAP
jgi:hypothetical protein